MKSSLSKPLLAASCSLMAVGVITGGRLFRLPALVVGLPSSLYAINKLSDRAPKEIIDGIVRLTEELLGIMPDADGKPAAAKLVLQSDVEGFLEGLAKNEDPTTPDFWVSKRAKRSAVLLGNRGSGKSAMQAFRFQQKVFAGVRCWISDIHRGAQIRDGREPTVWLPGISEDDFQERYLVKTAEDTLKLLKMFKAEAHSRLYENSEWNEEWDLTIDEWQAVWAKWSDTEREVAIKCFNAILDEADKVGIQVSITLHSLTREKTGLDGSLINGCDLYIFGGALANTANQIPSDMDRKALGKEKAELALSLSIQQRAVVYRDAISTESYAVISPDLSVKFEFEPAQPDEDVWLAENKADIEKRWGAGESVTAIAQALKLQQTNSNPKYLKLKEFYAALEVSEVA